MARSDFFTTPPNDAFYFGTHLNAGHYWFNTHALKHYAAGGEAPIDGRYYPSEREGDARLVHLKGWTILAFANRTDDSRPGSNSAFCFRGKLTFDESVARAHELFPWVTEHFKFEITEHVND